MIAVCAAVISMLAVGSTLPPVMGVDGHSHRLLIEAHGKPVVVLFIAHDCPVCNIYAPEIGRIEAKYGRSLQIGLVYTEPRLTKVDARKHAKEFGVDRASLFLDPNSEFAAACGAHFTPEAVLFDSAGRKVYSGRIDDRFIALGRSRPAATTHDLTLALDAVLAHRPPKVASGPPVGCIIVLPTKK